MSKKYELTPEGIFALEYHVVNRSTQEKSFEDSRLILHAVKRYAHGHKKNAIVFKKNGDIIFVQVRKTK